MSKRNRSGTYKKERNFSGDPENKTVITDPDGSIPETIDEHTEDFSFTTEDYLKAPWERDAEESADFKDPGYSGESPEAENPSDEDGSGSSEWAEESENTADEEETVNSAETGVFQKPDGPEEPENSEEALKAGEPEDPASSPEPDGTEDAETAEKTSAAEDSESTGETSATEDFASSDGTSATKDAEMNDETSTPEDAETADETSAAEDAELTGEAEEAEVSEETQDSSEEDSESFGEEPERDHWWRRLGRKFTFLIYGLAVLIIVVGGFSFYYLHSRQEPVDTVKKFLGSIQILDFDTMTGLLQDQDLSNLDGADIMNPSYQDFFRDINARMAYSIRKVQYSMRKGTAKVTAHIRYIDGTEIYTSVVSEFLREIVSSAFSGEMLTEDETTQKLVKMLETTAANLPETYAETEIAYPVVKTEYGWKIAVLDEQTVKVMSANFKNIEEEISRAMAQPQPPAEAPAETREEPSEEEDLPVIVEDNDIVSMQTPDVIHLEDDDYTIVFDHFDVAKDYAGNDCLLYYYTYTNNRSNQPSSALLDVSLKAFQEGKTLSSAIPNNADSALDNYYEQAGAGESLVICQAFLLTDRSNVSVQAAEASYDSTDVVSQVLRIQ